jgi:N-acetylglucosaminyl-diphospho-decaprenol L-rhamnosyltransferase
MTAMQGPDVTAAAATGAMPGAAKPRTLVVIVNYKVGPLVVECIRSLERETFGANGECLAHVTVVDNDSRDGSAAVIRDAIAANGWGAWVRLVESRVNGGFAYGNNTALRDAAARGAVYEHVWLLNPDTVVRPGALKALGDHLDANPRAGLAGSGVEQDEHGTRWPYAFRFPSAVGEFEATIRIGPISKLLDRWVVARRMDDVSECAQWLSGCSIMIRAKVFDAIGLMDEQFFLYYEEVDFCRRAVLAGWECWYVPASRVYHIAGRSTGISGEGASMRRIPAYWYESRRRYFVKHHGRAYAMLADAGWIVGMTLGRARHRLQGKSDLDPPHYFKDFVRHSAIFHAGLPVNDRLLGPARAAAGTA